MCVRLSFDYYVCECGVYFIVFSLSMFVCTKNYIQSLFVFVSMCVCVCASLFVFCVYHLMCISLYLCFYYFLKDHDNALTIDEKEEDEETGRNEGIRIVYKDEGS